VESLNRALQDEFPKGHIEHKPVVYRPARWILGEAQAAGCIALGVAIDDQSPHVEIRKRGSQIDGSCCLSDTALLIGNCDDSSQRFLPDDGYGESIKGKAVTQVKYLWCSTWNTFNLRNPAWVATSSGDAMLRTFFPRTRFPLESWLAR